MSLRSSLAIAASATQTSALDLTTGSAPINFAKSVALSSGTGAGKADRLFSDRRTLAASATEDLDLIGTGLVDAFGATVTFTRVKGLFIAADPDNVNDVLVGGASSNAWAALFNATGVLRLRPGATAGFIAGVEDATAYAVTAGTGDLLKVANGGAGSAVEYDIIVIGASA